MSPILFFMMPINVVLSYNYGVDPAYLSLGLSYINREIWQMMGVIDHLDISDQYEYYAVESVLLWISLPAYLILALISIPLVIAILTLWPLWTTFWIIYFYFSYD